MEKLKFTVDSALLSELGEKLVESVHIALVELVKNAYDADAENVTIRFVEGDTGIDEIHIIDDGNGMNFDDVKKYWMHIATTHKVERNISPRFGRPRTGSKGIGRFSCRRLGRKLKINTVGSTKGKRKEETEVIFDWNRFKPGKDVTEITCAGKITKNIKGKTGTALVISNLLDEWNTLKYQYIKRHLAVLVAGGGIQREGFNYDPGFNIEIDAPEFEEEIIDLREELFNAGWGTLTAFIDDKHRAVCKLNALGLKSSKYTSRKIFPHLNDISLKVGIMVSRREDMRDKGVLSIGSLSEILDYWGGVQVKYRGFRVHPYGDDDWLEIDHDRGFRKTAVKDELHAFAQSLRGVDPGRALLSLLSMDSYLGSVDIGPKAHGFDMKANREGFIDSDAVEELKEFARLAIDWATVYRDYFIRLKAKRSTEIARQRLEEIVQKEIAPDKVVEEAISHLTEEVKEISSLLPPEEKKVFNKTFYEATDAIAKQQKSNLEELNHLRVVASISTLVLIFSHEVKLLLGLLESSSSTLRSLAEKLSDKQNRLVKEMSTELDETKERFNQLLDMTSLVGIESRKAKPIKLDLKEKIKRAEKIYKLILDDYEIEFDYDLEPSNITVGPMLESELYAILLNALSNSIKSVIAHGRRKKIHITATREKGQSIIKIKDTGLGIRPEYYKDVFMPFLADPEGTLYDKLERKLNLADKYIVGIGSGLGLSIVRDIVAARKGNVRFRKPDDGWNAVFEVSLP